MSETPTQDEAIQDALSAVASAVLHGGEHPVTVPDEDRDRIAVAVQSGDIEVSDEGAVAFTVADALAAAVVARAASDAAACWDDLDELNRSLHRFTRVRYRLSLDDDVWTRLLLALRDDHGLDALDAVRRGAETVDGGEPHRVLWALYREVSKALPVLAPDPEHLAEQVGPILEAVANDFAGGSMYGAVRSYAATSEQTAKALVTAFLRDPDRPSVPLAANALQGLADHSLPSAHRWALDLTESETPAIQRAGIAALGWISYPDDSDGGRVSETLDALDRLSGQHTHDETLAAAVTQAFGELAKALQQPALRNRAVEGLVRLAEQGSPQARYVACRIAVTQANADAATPWVRRVFETVVDTSAEYKGIFDQIDHGLYRIASVDPEWCVGYLGRVVEGRDYGREEGGAAIDDLLSTSLQQLVQAHQPVLEAELTRWLASGRTRLQRAAGDIIGDLRLGASSGRAVAIRLDAAVLLDLDDTARQRAAFAILGYVLDGEGLAQLLLSLVWDRPSHALLLLVANMLADAVLYEFPGSARDHLVALAVREDTPTPAWDAIRFALVQSEAYYRPLRDRPDLKELQPPSRRLRRYRAILQDQAREMHAHAESQSALLDLVHKVPLKQGRSWFSERDGAFEEPSELESISTEIEVPRSLYNDPLGHQMRRVQWRQRAAGLDPTDA